MAGCVTGDVVHIGPVGDVVGFFSQGIDGVLSDIAASIMGAAVDLFSDLGNVPTLANDGEAINGQIHLQTNWLVVVLAVASLLVAAFRMALERKGQAGIEALKGLVRMVFATTVAWTVASWLAAEADSYSTHLYDQGIKAQLELISKCGTDGITAFLLIIIGLLLLVAGVVHVILMYIRLGLMTLLIGTLPLAAAASMTETGSEWWRKHIAWMVAWLLYKPTVGLIMYGGAAMIGQTGGEAKQYKLAGAGILLLAGVALPALMRLVVPAMAAIGAKDDGMGGATGALASAGRVVATGARKVGDVGGATSGGRGSGGGKSSTEPTGADSKGKATGADSKGKATGADSKGKATGADSKGKATGADSKGKATGTDDGGGAGPTGADSVAGATGTDSSAGPTGADSGAGATGADSSAGPTGADSGAGATGADSSAGPTGADDSGGPTEADDSGISRSRRHRQARRAGQVALRGLRLIPHGVAAVAQTGTGLVASGYKHASGVAQGALPGASPDE
ncbi:hypothetical protein ACIBEF_31555 [Micromonospora sp. NPDC050795]|uniref:hypothetical protein n=1 Tax=Micromonospora sp. NPDC050795 TaxID=3364282 RepID=UPI00379C156C